VSIGFVKGHGTQNDFVVLLDPEGVHDPSEGQVRALCDRRRGLGADGILRAVPDPSGSWFMDYRNADGGVVEMCGNGARLFAVALRDAGLVTDDRFTVLTRGGARTVDVGAYDGASWSVSVSMGQATSRPQPVAVEVDGGEARAGTAVWVPNPHAVVVVDDLADAGRLTHAPRVSPDTVFPDGVNVEFVVDRGVDPVSADGTLRIGMRVHERGVGETRSCGTGAVAAAWAWRQLSGGEGPPAVRVDVPGGTLYVTEHADGQLDLRGPAVIVARGSLDDVWWKENA
jgi:diaminopimelate epimerase